MSLRLLSGGRGTGYHPLRGALESALGLVYRENWPARLWALVPGACRVETRVVRAALLPPGSAPMRIGFVSDLHLGPTTPMPLLEAAFDELSRARLDALLLGGDYVFLDATPEKADALQRLVSRVPARHKLAVLGNHDLWTDHGLVEEALSAAGVTVLVNDGAWLGSDGLVGVVGLDDPWTGALDAERAFRITLGTAPEALVVLCHSPDGLPAAHEAHAELAPDLPCLYLCGHTHGGQVSTPLGPPIVPGRYGKRYPFGHHEHEGLPLFVSRGVGATELPVRTYAPPEVVIVEL